MSVLQACEDEAEDYAEAARRFDQLKQSGAFHAGRERLDSEIAYSAEMISDAWRAWGDVVRRDFAKVTPARAD
jgi:hypothetical protein